MQCKGLKKGKKKQFEEVVVFAKGRLNHVSSYRGTDSAEKYNKIIEGLGDHPTIDYQLKNEKRVPR